MEKVKKDGEWFDNPNIITNLLIGLIFLMIVLSQSFAINNNLSSINILRNIINHNMNYILVLVYFALIKTNFGKKYFNYLNVGLIILYLIFTITSCLSVFQILTLTSLLSLVIKILLFIYLIHTLLKDTNYWKELKISNSPFNEIDNEWYYYALVILSVFLLAVNLVLVTSFDGAVMALLECFYVILLSRYIYLYHEYLSFKKFKELNGKAGDK